jgi:multiple sugar transport system substrate-binding protein
MSQLVVSLVLLLSLVLVACQPEAPEGTEEPMEEPQETVTIEWWTVHSEEFTEEAQRAMAEEFEAAHPNIDVNVTVLPSSGFGEKMNTALGAGEGAPDVAFFWDENWWPMALDLTPYIEDDPDLSPDMYFEGYWNTRAKWGDQVVGLPLGVGANFVMYNKEVFDEAGVAYPTWDWTTEDFIDIATQLTDSESKRWGGDRPRGPYRAVFFNYGARPYSDDSTTVAGYLNGSESVAAFTWLWDLVDSGSTPTPADLEVLGTEGTGPVDLFLSGRLAMATLNQGHMLNAIEAGTDFGIVPEPGVPGNTRYVHGWSLTCSIWEGTEHPQEAYEFLSYWVGPEGQRFLMENSNLFPSIPSVLEEYEHADEEYAQNFFRILELDQTAEWLMAHPCYRASVQRVVNDIWDRIMIGEIERDEVEPTLDGLVPDAQDALDECVPRLGG